MASKTLTELIVERLKPATKEEGRIEIWDKVLPGFGVRVSASGTKTFMLMYRIGGKQKRLSLGRYHKEDFRLSQARDAARAAIEKAKEGIDPASPAPTGSVGSETAGAEIAPKVVAITARTPLSAALDLWINRQVKPRRSDWKEVERAIKFDLKPALGDRPIGTVTQDEIAAMMDAIIDRGARVHANRVLTMAKTFFKWCCERVKGLENPAAGISKPTEEVERERTLTVPELVRIWNASDKLGYPFGPIVRLLMLTAQRRDEVAGMAWPEIDIEGALWTLPAPPTRGGDEKSPARTKNRKKHEVALAPATLAVLAGIPRQGSSLLFSTTGKTVVSGWSRSKDRLDKLLMAPHDDGYG